MMKLFWTGGLAMLDTLRKLNTSSNLLLVRRKLKLASAFRLGWGGILFSFVAIGATSTFMFALGVAPYNVNMVYMLLTLFATFWFSLTTGVLTAVLAFLCFDYFFLPPIFSFTIDAMQGWIAIFLFLGTALFTNQISGRARLNSAKAQQRAQEVTSLYELATTVITQINRQEMLQTVLQQVSTAFDATSCTLFLASNETVELQLIEAVSVKNPNYSYTDRNREIFTRHPDVGLVQAVFKRNKAAFFSVEYYDLEPMTSLKNGIWPQQAAGRADAQTTRIGPVAYLPLASSSRELGVMVLVGRIQPQYLEFNVEERRLLEVFANHVALAVEHARLIEETALIATLRESDHFKSALLASVSHELRTPLTAVKTAVGNLLARDIEWTPEDQHEFLIIIEQESDRLTRLVSNLLDLTKIEGGVLKPNFGWHYLPEIVEEVIERLQNNPTISVHPISTSFALDIPLTKMDYLQIDQVLTNLLENAAKYSEPGSPIQVQIAVKASDQSGSGLSEPGTTAPLEPATLLVKVIDEGIGIPSAQLERVFDKFYRVQNGMDTHVPGTGIGLTIANGIVEAHGGRIWAENRIYGGTIFTFSLPVVAFDSHLPEDERQEK